MQGRQALVPVLEELKKPSSTVAVSWLKVVYFVETRCEELSVSPIYESLVCLCLVPHTTLLGALAKQVKSGQVWSG